MLTASVIGLAAALLGALITAGVWYDIAPLDLWSYPVATLLSVIAVVAAWIARAAGLEVVKDGGTFPGWMSLLAFILAAFTFIVTLTGTLAFLTTTFS